VLAMMIAAARMVRKDYHFAKRAQSSAVLRRFHGWFASGKCTLCTAI
jgi:hypothetical protein